MQYAQQPFVCRDAAACSKNKNRNHQAPKVKFLAMAERVMFIGRPPAPAHSDEHRSLVSGVYQRVNAFGPHRRDQFFVVFRAFAKHGNENIVAGIIASKDPRTYTILAEDGAALVGLLIAALGILLSHVLNMPRLDGIASILIGLLLAAVATFLIRECRGLLVGEGVDSKSEREIRKIASDDPLVEAVRRPLSMYLGPENALLTLDVQFRSTATVADVAKSIDRIKSAIRDRLPDVKRIYVEAETRQDRGR